MSETNTQRTARLLSMSNADLIMHAQDLTLERDTLREELAEARQEIADRKADCETGHDQDEKTIAELRQQLAEKDGEVSRVTELKNAMWYAMAASQARDQLSLDALNVYADAWNRHWKPGMPILQPLSDHVFSLPKDTAALESMISKAGEVMRERCAAACLTFGMSLEVDVGDCFEEEIRALPAVTIDDLKGGA